MKQSKDEYTKEVKELLNWMDEGAGNVNVNLIDEVLEFLDDSEMLNNRGEIFKHSFWKEVIHNDKFRKSHSQENILYLIRS